MPRGRPAPFCMHVPGRRLTCWARGGSGTEGTRSSGWSRCLTAALGRNSAGRVVGGYVDDQDRFHGFVQRGSRVATLDVPGARGTVASKINDDGAIVGFYTDGSGTAVAQAEHGFLYDGGRFRRIDVRGAAETRPFGINDGGQIVGEHVDAAGISHGYVRGLDGAVTSFDVPGAEATLPSDIDDGGQIVGAYYDRETQVVHGFLRAIDGTITTIDAPGTGFLTQAVGINEGGQIVGYSIDDCNVVRGFVRQADGSFATVEPPGGRSNTTVQDIDDQGRLVDQYGVLFSGYVRDPAVASRPSTPRGVVTETRVEGVNHDATSSAPTIPIPPATGRVSCAATGDATRPSRSHRPPAPLPPGSTTTTRSWAPSTRPPATTAGYSTTAVSPRSNHRACPPDRSPPTSTTAASWAGCYDRTTPHAHEAAASW
jgi:uncharacterized membrane protein